MATSTGRVKASKGVELKPLMGANVRGALFAESFLVLVEIRCY